MIRRVPGGAVVVTEAEMQAPATEPERSCFTCPRPGGCTVNHADKCQWLNPKAREPKPNRRTGIKVSFTVDRAAYAKEYYRLNRDRINEKHREWYKAKPEKRKRYAAATKAKGAS